jgi:hypothetical protein
MRKPEPEEIIAAFDEILDYVYGRSRGRDYPSKFDKKDAETWIEKGLTVPIASAVFYRQMSMMHERWLRMPPNDRTLIPVHIGYFAENIENALNRIKNGGENSFSDNVNATWKLRLRGWLKGFPWYENMWGTPPINPTTGKIQRSRVPESVIAEEIKGTVNLKKLGKVRALGG